MVLRNEYPRYKKDILKTMESHKQIEDHLIKALLVAVPVCQAIYRFGSWGTSAENPESDIDVAILPLHPLETLRQWEVAQLLASRVGRDVDLIDLLSAPTVLRMQIIAHGERLYCVDRFAIEQFEDVVFSSYARLNEERRNILDDIRQRGRIYA